MMELLIEGIGWFVVVIALVLLHVRIWSIEQEIENIKSWYPFIEICKTEVPEKFERRE